MLIGSWGWIDLIVTLQIWEDQRIIQTLLFTINTASKRTMNFVKTNKIEKKKSFSKLFAYVY